MSITDELRKWWVHMFPAIDRGVHRDFGAIADRIDEEAEDNERFRREAEPFCDRLREASAERADVTLFGVEYTALPLDADGVPIRVGDVIAYKDNTKPKEVVALVPPSVVMVDDGPRYADMCRHYKQPTVEDVLRDVVTLCHNTWKEESPFHFYDVDDVMKSGNIAEFAAKLRLAGDAE